MPQYPSNEPKKKATGGGKASGLSNEGKAFLPPPPPPAPVIGLPAAAGSASMGFSGKLAARLAGGGLAAGAIAAGTTGLLEFWSSSLNPAKWKVDVQCLTGPTHWATPGTLNCGTDFVDPNIAGGAYPPEGSAIVAFTQYKNFRPHPSFGGTWLADRVAGLSRQPGSQNSWPNTIKVVLPASFMPGLPFPEALPILQPYPPLAPPPLYPGVGTPAHPAEQPGEETQDPAEQPVPIVIPQPGWPVIITAPFPFNLPDIVVSPGTPAPQPGTRPRPLPGPAPGPGPSPAPAPKPDAPTQPKPGNPTLPQPAPAPGPPSTPNPPAPTAPPVPGVGTVPAPGTGTVPAPAPGANVIMAPPSHQDAPPRGREKQRKVQVRRRGGIFTLVNLATEALDLVDSLHKGIPKEFRRNCANHDYKCKLRDIYEIWDDPDYDVAAFVEAFINNHVEDMVYAAIGKRLGKASAGLEVTTGLNKAVGDHGERINENLFDDPKTRKKEGPQGNPLPELEITEHEDGSVTATVKWPLLGW